MISPRRYYHRRFGYSERFHIAMIFTILVVAYVLVPPVVRFVEAISGYNPAYYEPKDFERQDWLARQVVPAVLPGVSRALAIVALLSLLFAAAWHTSVSAR